MRQGSGNYKSFDLVRIQGPRWAELRREAGERSGLWRIVGHWPVLTLSLTRDSEVRAQAPRRRVRSEPVLQALLGPRTRNTG